MKTLTFNNSSAISKINLIEEENIIGIAYTSNNEKIYEFYCDDIESVKDKIQTAIEKEESIGKLIHSLRKNGEIESIERES